MSTITSFSDIWKPVEGDEPEDVVFSNLYGLRTIELNRPKKLNSLNASMIRKIAPRLMEWEKSDMANVIVIKGTGKAFCAGGDVEAVAKSNAQGPEGVKWSEDYFDLEYKLDHLIATYQKPYIAFMDGFTMGGGVGLSVHAPFRIATERTVFAMPETKIGFFPDVGASFFLPRMPGAVGTYLALTSEQLKGPNVFYAGIATHYLHSATLPMLESRLAELRFRDFDDLGKRLEIVNSTIEEYCSGLPHDQPIQLAGDLRNAIDRCFSKSSIEDIILALEEEEEPSKQWAQQTLRTLRQRSPTALHVALKQMQKGSEWSIAETFKREHQIAAKFMRHPDFNEGVRALLVDKDNAPKWQPATLEEIEGDVVTPFFESSSETAPLELLTNRDYAGTYPHAGYGIPTEEDVKRLTLKGELSQSQLTNSFVAMTDGKQGIREVVTEIVSRKTTPDEKGKAEWIATPAEEGIATPDEEGKAEWIE